MQTLEYRRDTKILQQDDKYLCDEINQMKGRFSELAGGRLQRGSFIHRAERLKRQNTESPWAETDVTLEVKTTVSGIFSKRLQSMVVLRTGAMATIEDTHPAQSWIRAYTDGSNENAMRNGGTGVYIESPDETIITSATPTGDFCSNYAAEIQAIVYATEELKESPTECHQIVFLTNSL